MRHRWWFGFEIFLTLVGSASLTRPRIASIGSGLWFEGIRECSCNKMWFMQLVNLGRWWDWNSWSTTDWFGSASYSAAVELIFILLDQHAVGIIDNNLELSIQIWKACRGKLVHANLNHTDTTIRVSHVWTRWVSDFHPAAAFSCNASLGAKRWIPYFLTMQSLLKQRTN